MVKRNGNGGTPTPAPRARGGGGNAETRTRTPHAGMPTTRTLEDQIWEALASVVDPELPLTVMDLGLIDEVRVTGGHVRVRMTPTYSACPAIEVMREFAPGRPTAVVARWRREPVSGSPQRRGRPRGPSCGSWTTTGRSRC